MKFTLLWMGVIDHARSLVRNRIPIPKKLNPTTREIMAKTSSWKLRHPTTIANAPRITSRISKARIRNRGI